MTSDTTPGGDGHRVLRYQRVVDLVVDMIEQQGLKPGDRLPSTAELAELADVSVISVRRALDELTHAGKIVRHQGLGTFVATGRMVSDPARPGSLLVTLEGEDVVLTTELVSLTVGLPSAAHAEALGIEQGQPVWEICRLRHTGGVPKVLERAVIPLSVVPALDEQRLANGESLYGFLERRYDLTEDFVEEALEVDSPDAWERAQLRVVGKDPVVRIRGISVAPSGVVFDSFQQTYLAREFVFYTSGSARQRLVGPSAAGPWAVRPLGGSASGSSQD